MANRFGGIPLNDSAEVVNRFGGVRVDQPTTARAISAQPQAAPTSTQADLLNILDTSIADRSTIGPRSPARQPGLEQGDDFSLGQTITNIPSSAVQLGRDIIEPILSPIETAKSLQSLGQGIVEKVFVPQNINGFNFGQTENEEVVDAVGTFINERYGSSDAFKQTVQEDPVGVVADLAGLLTGGAALAPKVGKAGAIAGAAQNIGKAIDPLNLSISAVRSLTKSGKLIPKGLPEKLLESAMKFRPSINPKQRASMTRTALDQGIMPNITGLRNIADKLGALDNQLNVIIDGATASGKSIPKNAIFAQLKKLRRELGGAKLDARPDLRIINNLAKQFDQNLKRLKKTRLTPRELQDLKTDAYKRINFDIQSGGAGFAKNEARKAIARQAKQSLEALDPNVQPINRQMGDLLELNKELERVVTRLDNRNLISLDTAVKLGAGAATGTPAGVAVGAAASVLGAPRVKAKTALILENIRRNAETTEIITNKLSPVLARVLLTQAGRLNQSLNEQMEEQQ